MLLLLLLPFSMFHTFLASTVSLNGLTHVSSSSNSRLRKGSSLLKCGQQREGLRLLILLLLFPSSLSLWSCGGGGRWNLYPIVMVSPGLYTAFSDMRSCATGIVVVEVGAWKKSRIEHRKPVRGTTGSADVADKAGAGELSNMLPLLLPAEDRRS